jgi:hypothetical protein
MRPPPPALVRMEVAPDARPPSSLRHPAPLLALAGALATVAGLILHGVWRELPAERLLLSLVLMAIAWLVAWPLRRAVRCSAATAFALAWLLALVAYCGPLPVLAVALLAAAAWAVGDALLPATSPGRPALAVTLGLILIAMLAGWTLIWPIHHPIVWATLLLVPVVLRRRALGTAARDAASRWRATVATAPRAAAWAVMLVGVASVACWIPTLQSDDLGYHLNLPTQLMLHGRYAPDAEYQVWSYAPWAGDALHGIAFVLARQDAHGALNALWLLLIAALIGGPLATAMRATPLERWIAVALFAAFPPLVWMAAGLQTELASTAVLVALVALILAPASDARVPRGLFAGAVLFAGLFALKLVHGLVALPLLAFALWRHRAWIPWRWLPLACLLCIALATSSHVHAWLSTGNPVLPMFNHVFESPFFPREQFHDPRWHAGFGPDILWRLTFDTARYVEGWPGGLGFGLIALAGLWLLRLVRPTHGGPHPALFVAVTACVLLPLLPMQYARYAWPGMILLLALLCFGAEAALGRRLFFWLFVGLCALNLAYQANASWLHHAAAVKRTIRSIASHETVVGEYVPERVLIRRIPHEDARAVLAADPARNVVAELAGRGRTTSLHDPSLATDAEVAERDASGEAWAALFSRERIGWTLVHRATASHALDAGLRRAGAQRVESLHEIELWRMPPSTTKDRP